MQLDDLAAPLCESHEVSDALDLVVLHTEGFMGALQPAVVVGGVDLGEVTLGDQPVDVRLGDVRARVVPRAVHPAAQCTKAAHLFFVELGERQWRAIGSEDFRIVFQLLGNAPDQRIPVGQPKIRGHTGAHEQHQPAIAVCLEKFIFHFVPFANLR